MADSFVQVPADSGGKKLQTFNSTVGANSVHSEAVTLTRSSDNTEVGTSAQPVRTDPTGTTPQPVSGTVTANIGTSGSLALDASVTGLQVAQASTTSGQKGELQQGAVTTNAPTYTTAQTDPLSLDTSGNLRVSVKDSPANTNKFLVTADPVTFASAQAVTQSGTWTVQPGNTANTTAWLVTEDKTAGAPLVGQAKVAVTGTAVQLGANALKNGVIITAKSTNAASISLGGSGVNNTVDGTGNGYILEAGASTSFAVDNSNRVYINGTAGDIVSFAGS